MRDPRATTPRRLLAATAVAALAPLLVACGPSAESESDSPISGLVVDDQGPFAGAEPARPYPVAARTLTDTEGRAFRFGRDTEGTLDLVFFGYTKCPDTCQIVMSTIASALNRLEPAERERVRMLFVTTDPARDTGPVMRDYLDRFDPEFTGLTGSLDQIVALGRPWGIDVRKGRRLPSGGYEVDHTTSVLGLDGRTDPQGVRVVWSAASSPAAVADDLSLLLSEKP